MKIREWSWRNICSYGNKLQTIKISSNPQLVLVYGQNGAGKSSIAEALTVSIYGRSIRRKQGTIPNRLNRNAQTTTVFESNSGDLIELERGIDPNYSSLKINGTGYNLPDKREVDKFIEEQIVKIPLSVFANTINLSINDFKSFIQLSPSDKRKIIDKIFGLDEINQMQSMLKDDTKTIKADIATIENLLTKSKHHYQRTNTSLQSILESQNVERESEILKLEEENKEKLKFKEKLKVDAEQYVASIKKVRTEIDEAKEKIQLISANQSVLKEKIELYKLGKCPQCESDLTDHDHIESLKESQKTYDSLEQEKRDYNIHLKSLVKQESDDFSVFDLLKGKITNINSTVQFNSMRISELKNSNVNGESEALKKSLSEMKEEIESIASDLYSKKEKLQINLDLEAALSDSGIKKIIMGNIIPTLNQKILKISKALEFKFAFEFDEDFNPIITHIGHEISPDSLSTGEGKKMNLVILLSIIEIIMMKQNGSNILFLDEIFASLDADVVYKVVDTLKTFARKYSMTIFVVSHEWLPEEFFDTILSVRNVDNFSEIEIKKT